MSKHTFLFDKGQRVTAMAGSVPAKPEGKEREKGNCNILSVQLLTLTAKDKSN